MKAFENIQHKVIFIKEFQSKSESLAIDFLKFQASESNL